MSHVKIMLSSNYNNFEVSLNVPDDATLEEVDNRRKDCQRLADKAVAQFKLAQEVIYARMKWDQSFEWIEHMVENAQSKDESERNVHDKAYIFVYEQLMKANTEYVPYDYDDDWEDYDYSEDFPDIDDMVSDYVDEHAVDDLVDDETETKNDMPF